MNNPNWREQWSARRASFAEECRQARDDLLNDLKDPMAAQRRVRDDVIQLCAASSHWKEKGYDVLLSDPNRFRSVLPIMRYEDFVEELEREKHTKGGVLSCSPVLRWLKTSGTTGTPKYVPYTLHWLLNYRIPAMKAMWGTYTELHPEILDHPHATLDTQTVREDVFDFVHGVQHQAISNRQPKINSRDWNPPWYDAPWFDSEMPSEHTRRMYHRARHLLGENLHFISAINPSTLVSLRDLIAARGQELVRDLREGLLEGQPYTSPNEEAARHLETVLADEDFSLKDVWPSLTLYSCWLSASAGLYQSKLDAIFPGVDRVPFMSCGTEGVTTIPVDEDVRSQPFAVGQAFFEFVPTDVPLGELVEAGTPVPTLLLDEVEEGHDYHLIMTQGNGLYRLWTGDIYRVDRIENGAPRGHFVHRNGVFHSFTGEKITEAQVTQSIQRAMTGHGLETGLYLCGPKWGDPPNYVVVVEADEPSAELDRTLSEAVDRELREINIEYDSKRESGRLHPLEVLTVRRDAIAAHAESHRRERNANQYKYKPFQQDIDFVDEIVGS
ncbi:GH3 auxin-responsive promoter [Actinopolyspora erythraea]|uniref:GH3 auxin-responsive promoter n=1 Tax=Actinopolyspora erythraea TaxID=414996 RepID=A0A099D5X8_9ACTN|nr:GH3 auxin-responsive promoter family protein [Actinopolyspora erythraea]ASU78666.1 GH3 auxin-responsive promoter [Actinopolyspora erythraea]KGI81424.1 GH3 auxin-responsive promoter [Actinopolyspora erythraea]